MMANPICHPRMMSKLSLWLMLCSISLLFASFYSWSTWSAAFCSFLEQQRYQKNATEFTSKKTRLRIESIFFFQAKRWVMLPWIIATFLFLLAYLAGVIISIILIGRRFEILLLLGFAIVETAIGFYLWVCIVSLFQVNNSAASPTRTVATQLS